MKKYNITGMSCAACSARVEKAVSKVARVKSCSVNLLTNSLGIEGDAAAAAVIQAVEEAGYGAAEASAASGGGRQGAPTAAEDALLDKESPALVQRLPYSLIFLVALLYLSMGRTMWHFPLPKALSDNAVMQGLMQLLLSAAVLIINQKFFVSGFKSMIKRAPNMDTLVALGSGTSFAWSVAELFAMTTELPSAGGMTLRLRGLYFESAAMIVTLITVGKLLEARAKGKTTTALQSLLALSPKTVSVERDGAETVIPAFELMAGEIFIVRAGESFAADGLIIEGSAAIDESALTGESLPVDKSVGDRVHAATINMSGFLKCRAARIGSDTAIAKIIDLVSEAAATKAPAAKIADKVSGIFVPAVIAIAILTIAAWLLAGQDFSFALARGISALVISCPCALGLATPVAIMVAGGIGAKHGILFKTSEALENAGKVQIIALDKTGTVTNGTPAVTDIIPAEGVTERDLLQTALSLEVKSEHPLAKAVVQKARKQELHPSAVTDFSVQGGSGVRAQLEGNEAAGGNCNFISERARIPERMQAALDALSAEGKTPLLFSRGERLLGIIAVSDTLKDDSAAAVQRLKAMGIKTVLLTGDNERTATVIGKALGVDRVIAGILPDGKAAIIEELKRLGKTAMVGDGINDAPALALADTGIAIGAGADIAVESGSVVLVNGRLDDVPAAIALSRAALRTIHENLFWAFFYNVIGIPLAAGAYIRLFGWTLNPMFGAAAMSLSSFCVVMNALRLNLLNIRDSRRDRKVKKRIDEHSFNAVGNNKEGQTMKKMLKIEGMMCSHCEARVIQALEQLDGVESAVPSSKAGSAFVTMSADIPAEILKTAVERLGYTVTGIEE